MLEMTKVDTNLNQYVLNEDDELWEGEIDSFHEKKR